MKKTFAALSVDDIPYTEPGQQIDTLELERFVARLVGSKRLDARLVQSTDPSSPTILRFATAPFAGDLSSEVATWAALVTQKDRIQPLTQQVRETGAKFELNREYIDSVRKSKRHKENGSKDGRPGPNEMDIEEDIMAGAQ